MQKEERDVLFQYRVQRYHNRSTKPLSNKRVQLVQIRRSSLAVRFEDGSEQEQDQDCFNYDRIAKVSSFVKDGANVIAVTLKKDGRPNISFRVQTEKIGQEIVKVVMEKVNEIEKLPDYTDLLTKEEEIIQRIQETESEYRDIWGLFQNKIDRKLLNECLFYDHESVVEFQRLAKMKGYEKEKRLVMVELRERVGSRMDEEEGEGEDGEAEAAEKYDFQKSLEGVRVQDDDRKLRYAPNAEECQDDLFFNQLPNVREEDICDQFREMDEQPMEIESDGIQVINVQSDVRKVSVLNLPRAEKGRYKISQSKELFTGVLGKVQRRKEETVELNVKQARRVVLTLKLFYKMVALNPSLSDVTAIEEHLNRILNSEVKLPGYLETPIKKTIATILRWKRERHV